MANRHRGEIAAELDGRARTLVLTLGALAELEAAFGVEDLLALAERFERGRLSARDAVRIVAAGLRGAGENVTDEEVARMTTPGAAAGFARIVGALIAATFGTAPEAAGEGSIPPPGVAGGTTSPGAPASAGRSGDTMFSSAPSAPPGGFAENPPAPPPA